MTQTLLNSLSGVELLFFEKIDVSNFVSCFSSGEKYNLWLIEVETDNEMRRFRGVDMKNDWMLIYIDMYEDYAYCVIPTNNIQNITEEKLKTLYVDIGKRFGAQDICFNGKSIMRTIRDLKDMQVKIYTDINDLLDEYECPSYIFEFVNNAEYYISGKCICEDFKEAYNIRMNRFIKDVKLTNLETATATLQKIYQSYVHDGYENDFWQDFILQLNYELMYPEFKLIAHGHTIYYDYKKKITINLH